MASKTDFVICLMGVAAGDVTLKEGDRLKADDRLVKNKKLRQFFVPADVDAETYRATRQARFPDVPIDWSIIEKMPSVRSSKDAVVLPLEPEPEPAPEPLPAPDRVGKRIIWMGH